MQTQSHRLLDRVNALLDRMPLRSRAEHEIECHQYWNHNMIEDSIQKRFITNMNAITSNQFEPSITTPFEFDTDMRGRFQNHIPNFF